MLKNIECVKFTWNKRGGIMLDIGDVSFRFRGKEGDDYQHTRTYNDNRIRKFSCSSTFITDLQQAICNQFEQHFNPNKSTILSS